MSRTAALVVAFMAAGYGMAHLTTEALLSRPDVASYTPSAWSNATPQQRAKALKAVREAGSVREAWNNAMPEQKAAARKAMGR